MATVARTAKPYVAAGGRHHGGTSQHRGADDSYVCQDPLTTNPVGHRREERRQQRRRRHAGGRDGADRRYATVAERHDTERNHERALARPHRSERDLGTAERSAVRHLTERARPIAEPRRDTSSHDATISKRLHPGTRTSPSARPNLSSPPPGTRVNQRTSLTHIPHRAPPYQCATATAWGFSRPRWSTGSATDAVADVGGLRRVDHPNDLQLDQRRQHVEQPAATGRAAPGSDGSAPRPAPRPRAPVAPCTRHAPARPGPRRQPSPAPSRFRSHRSRTSPTDSPNGRPGRAAGDWARRSGDRHDHRPSDP